MSDDGGRVLSFRNTSILQATSSDSASTQKKTRCWAFSFSDRQSASISTLLLENELDHGCHVPVGIAAFRRPG